MESWFNLSSGTPAFHVWNTTPSLSSGSYDDMKFYIEMDNANESAVLYSVISGVPTAESTYEFDNASEVKIKVYRKSDEYWVWFDGSYLNKLSEPELLSGSDYLGFGDPFTGNNFQKMNLNKIRLVVN